jgi:excisionase family DNA binding protein
VLAEAGARAVLAELAELAALPADPEAPEPPAPEVPRPPETPEDCGARPWTVAELAATCSVSVSYVRKCIKVGSLEAHRLGRVVRISAPEARRFAADLGVMPLPLAHQTHDAHGAHQTHTVKLKLAERKASA